MKKRRIYTINKQFKVIKEISTSTQKELSTKYGISRSNIYFWNKMFSRLKNQKYKSMRRTLPYQNTNANKREEKILAYIKLARETGILLKRSLLFSKIVELVPNRRNKSLFVNIIYVGYLCRKYKLVTRKFNKKNIWIRLNLVLKALCFLKRSIK